VLILPYIKPESMRLIEQAYLERGKRGLRNQLPGAM